MKIETEDGDKFLLTQIQSGNEEAFNFIFRKYYKVLVVQSVRFVHDQDTAQSLVQNCFIKFWEKRHELQNIENLCSYLFIMMRNKSIDHLRKQQRMHSVPLTVNSDFLESVTDETIDANDLSTHLWQAIAVLPERCRKAFEFSRIDGLTYSQIAQKMGISNKAVEALISRSLKLLRANLVDFLGILIFLLHI